MAEVIWLDEALDQLELIGAYIRIFDPAAADRVRKRLIDLADSLEHFPNRARPAARDTRELVTVPPYILRYIVRGDSVFVLSVRHGARRFDD